MHYGLSQDSFTHILSQAKNGDRAARIFLRLACFTTSSALKTSNTRTGQFVLSKEQLELLKSSDNSFQSFIEGLNIDYSNVAKLEIGEVAAQTPESGSLELPEKSISQDTLFTTPTWLCDLGSGYYGPSIRFGDLIAAWRSEGLPLPQLTGIVSLIDPENGKGLLNESHIINGIGLKGSNPSDPSVRGSQVSLIKPDDWFSLAQFGAVLQTIPASEEVERLTDSLLKNDFTTYSDKQAYLFIADITLGEKSCIRREFSPSTYQEMPEAPFSSSGSSTQYLDEITKDTPLTAIGKIHPIAETGYGGKLDTNLHIHVISPTLLDLIFRENSEKLYDHSDEFLRVDKLLVSLSLSEKLYCGHLITGPQCFFKSVEKVHAVQPLSNVIEVSKTGTPAHNLLTGEPVEGRNLTRLASNSTIWKKAAQNSPRIETENLNIAKAFSL